MKLNYQIIKRYIQTYSIFFFLDQLEIIKDSGLAKHDSLLHEICDSLQPIFYNKYCYIVREGDPIDAVFFITAGTVWTYTNYNGEGSDSRHTECLAEGQHFGGELLDLVLTSTSDDISKVPVSSKTLKTYTKVEAFALMAHDLKRIWQSNRISKRKSFFLFYPKNLLFLFYTPIFTKYPHQSIYSTHLFNKIFILLQSFIISSLTTLSHTQHYQKNTKILYAHAKILFPHSLL